MKVRPTPKDKGLVLDIEVVAYDNGMVQVDGIPINASPNYDPADGWLSAAEVMVLTLNEFRRQADARKRQRR
jgi:hypothetical protein